MKVVYAIIITMSYAINSFGQDPHFSQNDVNPLMINPGNTALNHDLRAIVNYRNQWSSFTKPYQTIGFSFDMNTAKDKSRNAYLGLGVQFLNDKAGDSQMSLTQGNLNVSGVLRTGDLSKLSLGLMGGFGQRSVNFNDLRWSSQYDGAYNSSLSSNENFSSTNYTYFDAGVGLVWTYGKNQAYISANDDVQLNIGISAAHLDVARSSFENEGAKLDTRFNGFIDARFGKRNTHLSINPSLYYTNQGSLHEVVVGSNFRYLLKEGSHFTGFVKTTAISLGAHYRYMDAVIASIRFDYSNYSLGVSYDFNVSELTPASNGFGGLELSLKFVTPNPFKNTSRSKFR